MDKKYYTNKELKEIARDINYNITCKEKSHGQLIFTNGKYYITHDVDSHNGGFWKKAKNIRNLSSKSTRNGTYDRFLNRIGD